MSFYSPGRQPDSPITLTPWGWWVLQINNAFGKESRTRRRLPSSPLPPSFYEWILLGLKLKRPFFCWETILEVESFPTVVRKNHSPSMSKASLRFPFILWVPASPSSCIQLFHTWIVFQQHREGRYHTENNVMLDSVTTAAA